MGILCGYRVVRGRAVLGGFCNSLNWYVMVFGRAGRFTTRRPESAGLGPGLFRKTVADLGAVQKFQLSERLPREAASGEGGGFFLGLWFFSN